MTLSLVPQPPTTGLQDSAETLKTIEGQLFGMRREVEELWIEMGRLCSHIMREKLYRFAQDEQGNHFRTGKAYFQDLERRFRDAGWETSQRTLFRYMQDVRLFEEELGLQSDEMTLLGKTTLQDLAPAVRKLQQEQGEDAAKAFVEEVVEAAKANEGLPRGEVRRAVDDVTGRVTKGLEAHFSQATFGQKLATLTLYWGDHPINLLSSQVTDEQAEWVMRRLGIKPTDRLL